MVIVSIGNDNIAHTKVVAEIREHGVISITFNGPRNMSKMITQVIKQASSFSRLSKPLDIEAKPK